MPTTFRASLISRFLASITISRLLDGAVVVMGRHQVSCLDRRRQRGRERGGGDAEGAAAFGDFHWSSFVGQCLRA